MSTSQSSFKSFVLPMIIIGALFFVFGFVTWLNGILIPYLQIACDLSDFQAMFVAFAFYIAYTIMALPSSWVIKKMGFKNGMMVGLWVWQWEHLYLFLQLCLELTIAKGKIEMLNYPDFFVEGYNKKWDKDVYHFLNSVADRNTSGKRRGLCHRLVRAIVDTRKVTDKENLDVTIERIINDLESCYDGGKNSPEVQKMKGMIREFEEELVWAHFGTPVKNVHHLRLGFYKGDVFTESLEKNRDMLPVLEEFRKHKPTTISLAMDPEGSGPDTHYKVLQAIAGAVKEWKEEEDLSNLRIIGYRNVWFKYHPAEADTIVPVSLNALDVLENSFTESYLSQVNASFPSYEYDGKFNELTQKVWVDQLKQIQMLLGKNFFYENNHPLVRATHGLLYMKEMSADEFVAMAQDLEKAVEENPF